jgi:AcrR family transcriptional regulator
MPDCFGSSQADQGPRFLSQDVCILARIALIDVLHKNLDRFDGLTVQGVAARAGVGKTTIYRRWPDIWSVVVDAVLDEVNRTAPVEHRATARESFAVSMRLVRISHAVHAFERTKATAVPRTCRWNF